MSGLSCTLGGRLERRIDTEDGILDRKSACDRLGVFFLITVKLVVSPKGSSLPTAVALVMKFQHSKRGKAEFLTDHERGRGREYQAGVVDHDVQRGCGDVLGLCFDQQRGCRLTVTPLAYEGPGSYHPTMYNGLTRVSRSKETGILMVKLAA